jgi:hypothetical protein
MGFVAGGESRLTGGDDVALNGTVSGLSGSDLHLVVALLIADASTGVAITCNGVGLTYIDQSPSANGRSLQLWHLDAPTAGTLAASWTGSSLAWMGWQVFDDVADITLASFAEAGGVTGSTTETLAVATASGDDVADFLAASHATATPTAGQTDAYTPGTQNLITLYGSYAVADDTSYDMQWTLSTSSEFFYHVGIALEPTGGGGGSVGFRPYYL